MADNREQRDGKHRWWHLQKAWYVDGTELVLVCRICLTEMRRCEDDGYRCEIDGSAFCSPEAHH